MKAILIIQARMGSTRLPGKVLRPLGSTVVLDYVVTRALAVEGVSDVIVATSTKPKDDVIVRWCMGRGVSHFRGSEEDVLSRYYECAKLYSPDYVMRVTSDCPFFDVEQASSMVALASRDRPDAVESSRDQPIGLAPVLVSFAALERIHRVGQAPRHREHVTSYAFEFPTEFAWSALEAPEDVRGATFRITLDTAGDYELCQALARAFPGDLLVRSGAVVSYLRAHPEVAALDREGARKIHDGARS